jgi:hypothetical protein
VAPSTLNKKRSNVSFVIRKIVVGSYIKRIGELQSVRQVR